MFKKLFILLIGLVYINHGYTQGFKYGKKLLLFTGFEFKSQPFYLGKQDGTKFTYFPVDANKSTQGPRIEFGLAWNLEKIKLQIRYSNTLRYGHIYYNLVDTNSNYIGASNVNYSVKDFTIGQNISIEKYFKIKENFLNVGLGYSLLNINSDYSYSFYFNSISSARVNSNFNYHGLYTILSYGIKQLELGTRILLVDKENHQFIRNQDFSVVSIFINYYFY
jgi:hypothetical protein